MNRMQWIRDYYGVPARKGTRVLFKGQPGTIIRASLPYIRVLLDGEDRTRLLHPVWMVEYPSQQKETPTHD